MSRDARPASQPEADVVVMSGVSRRFGAFEALKAHFSTKEIADLTLGIGMINLWNRLAISFRSHPMHEVLSGYLAFRLRTHTR